jgi:TPR repeat protein
MKSFRRWFSFVLFAISFCSFEADAAVHVGGYTRKNGTYVAPHYRSAPNHTKADNYSTKGNVNPYTGKAGTKNVGGLNPGPASGGYTGTTPQSPINSGANSASEAVITPNTERPTAPATTSEKSNLEQHPNSANTQSFEMHYEKNDQLLEFQKQNAAKGMPESQYSLGMRYLNGIGVEKDEKKANEYLEKSAAQGNLKARTKLKELNKLRVISK